MILTAKQRIKRMEGLVASLSAGRKSVSKIQVAQAIQEDWLALDEEGNRAGPDADVSSETRRVYEMAVLMEMATCRLVTEEV